MYFSVLTDLTNEIIKQVQDQCPFNLKQVQLFLENYSCSSKNKKKEKEKFSIEEYISDFQSDIIGTSDDDRGINRVFMKNAKEIETTSSTESSPIDYFDDLKFISSNQKLLNSTEQTVYVVCSSFFFYFRNIFLLIFLDRTIINIIMFHILFQNLRKCKSIFNKMMTNLFVFMNFRIDIDQHLYADYSYNDYCTKNKTKTMNLFLGN